MARKRGAGRDEVEVFLSELSIHGSVRKACAVAGVSRSWFRERKKLDEDFALAVADAIEDSTDRLEEVGHRMARAGDEKLIRFLLEVRRYKKSTDVDLEELKPNINVTVQS